MKISTEGTYYGSMRSEWKAGGIILSEYDYVLPATDWHFHENPYFMYVLQGKVLDMNKNASTRLVPGSLIYHNWQEAHWNKNASENTRGFHVEFDRNWFKERNLNVGKWEGSETILDPSVHHTMAKIYAEFKSDDSFSNISIELLLIELCEKIDQISIIQPESPPLWIDKLKELVHENSEALSLNELSVALGVHPVHISRAIPKHLSTTLGNYIRKQRVKQSLPLLLEQGLSLTEIAYHCGFSDQSHFTRTFKLFLGMTPKAYRRMVSS